MLIKMQVADYPNLKSEQRRKLHKRVYKLAYPIEKEVFATIEDIKKALRTVNHGR